MSAAQTGSPPHRRSAFLFPAFDDRATNPYGALYYTKNTDNSEESRLRRRVFNLQPPMPAGTQRETFREA